MKEPHCSGLIGAQHRVPEVLKIAMKCKTCSRSAREDLGEPNQPVLTGNFVSAFGLATVITIPYSTFEM